MGKIFCKSPTELYEEGDWYILLSAWIIDINERSEQMYMSMDSEERSKRGLKRHIFKFKGDINNNIIYKSDIDLKPKTKTIMDKFNELK